jgi:hypothetical protein
VKIIGDLVKFSQFLDARTTREDENTKSPKNIGVTNSYTSTIELSYWNYVGDKTPHRISMQRIDQSDR